MPLRELILSVAESLASSLPPAENWDQTLPNYACLTISEKTSLVVARSSTGLYVFSLVTGRVVSSALVSENDDKADVVDHLNMQSFTGLKKYDDSHLAEKIDTPNIHSHPKNDSDHSRDPNAAPGFEYELYPSQAPNIAPAIQFDPDQDRYPPGGRNPTMTPMTRHPFRGTDDNYGNNSDLRIDPSIGGMMPSTTSRRAPAIRYDPTHPFNDFGPDSDQGGAYPPGGSFGGPSFGGPPFSGGPPFGSARGPFG